MERELRRPGLHLHDVWEDAFDALDARRCRGRRKRPARDEELREGVGVQTSVAVGLHLLHERRAQTGSQLVLYFYWLWTASRDGKIENVTTTRTLTAVTVRQMADTVTGRAAREVRGDRRATGSRWRTRRSKAIQRWSWPVDVWFNGSRTFQAVLDFGGRAIQSIQLDPGCRFPDRDASDNVWPKPAAGAAPAPAGPPGAARPGTCAG